MEMYSLRAFVAPGRWQVTEAETMPVPVSGPGTGVRSSTKELTLITL